MLIKTIAQLRTASAINISNNIDNWLPYISDAEQLFVIPIIGQGLYLAIDEIVNPVQLAGEPPSDNDVLNVLGEKVCKAVALYALHLGVDEMALSISSAGIQVLQSDTHKPAPQYQIMNLKETYLSRAHQHVDNILEYIAANYNDLPAFTMPVNPYFIRSADEFQVHADIHGSRRVFLSLLPIIGSIEQKYIKPTLSPLLFDALKQVFQSKTPLSPDNQALIDLVVPPLVHLTMARALIEISIDKLDWGIFNSAANTFNNIQNKAQANKDRISAMHDANQRDGEAELKMLQEFLDLSASISKYALYYGSNRYVGPLNAVKRADFFNDSGNSIFVV